MRLLTTDFDEKPHGQKRFYTTEQVGEKRSLTPEGFLLCEDVPLARIGSQLYGSHELPGLRAKDGLIRIMRDEDEVFRPQTIISFAGKPVTNDHPPEKVTPLNWRQYAVGTVSNPRRGDGVNFDESFLFGDLLITDAQAIKDLQDGKREVSAGYDAEYEQTQDGEGRQYNIVGNHVALVKKGRCGPLCMIGDSEMATIRRRLRRSTKDRIMDAIRNGDEDKLVDELDRVEEMLGEPVSGEENTQSRDEDGRVVINLNGSGGGSSGGTSLSAGGGATGDQPEHPDPGAASQTSASDPALAQIMQRLDRIEQAIVILANGDDDNGNGDDPDAGMDPAAGNTDPDEDGFRDEDAGAPPSEDPALRPGNNLTYGEGTGSTNFRNTSAGGTNDRGRRGTRDRHATRDSGQFVGDSTSMQSEFQDTVARAEVLVSGFTVPTFDARRPARATFDTLCGLRRGVLERASNDPAKRPHVETMMGGKQLDFRSMTCDAVSAVFVGASELARRDNNSTVSRARGGSAAQFGGALSPADINKQNRERYKIN